MIPVTDSTLTSTVSALPDQVLLAQTRSLARHEQALQILVLDHLREIEARALHLRRGYSSLFDYAVRELGYSDGARLAPHQGDAAMFRHAAGARAA